MSENGNEKYNAALEANVIEAVVIEKINEVNNDDNSITYEYKLTFAWSSAFEGKNPYTYFNQYSKSENSSIVKTEAAGEAQAVYYTYKELAELYIGKVYELNGADFTVTISATGKGIETQNTDN